LSAQNNHYTVTEYLLNQHAAVNQPNNFGVTPLHASARRGHQTMVDLLLIHRANIQACDDDGEFPLFISAQRGDFPIVKLLVAKRANINQINKNTNKTTYDISQECNYVVIMNYLRANHGLA
jgi:ankyrin repeat protein